MGFLSGIIKTVAKLTVVGHPFVRQMEAQEKQARALNEANEMRRRQDLLRQAQERQQQIRQARVKQGQIAQAAINQGAGGDSAALGGFFSVGTQRNTNLGFLNANSDLANRGSLAESAAIRYGQKAQMWGQIGNLIVQGATMGMSGGFGGGGTQGATAYNTRTGSAGASQSTFSGGQTVTWF